VEDGHPFVVDVQVEPEASAVPLTNIAMASRENAHDRAIRRTDLLGAP
jgi:hypothetical protein